MNNVYVCFDSAHQNLRKLMGGFFLKIFILANLQLGQKCHFCPPQIHVNSVVLRQNKRKHSICVEKLVKPVIPVGVIFCSSHGALAGSIWATLTLSHTRQEANYYWPYIHGSK